jgi:DNA-binding GntR family transcriptional regulator
VAPVDGLIREGPAWPYVQIAGELRRLTAGLQPDQQLPSIARLCQEYGVSPATARRAVGVLAAEGLVYTVPGRGTFKAR